MKNRLPQWFKQEFPSQDALSYSHKLKGLGVNTVCREAKCPNLSRCFSNSELTFMLLGDKCSRACKFCNLEEIKHPFPGADYDEPKRVAARVKELRLKYVVLTSVTRDDLADGGAEIFIRTIELIRNISKSIKVEALIPDFKHKESSIAALASSCLDVIAHNIETVRRLYPEVRPQADYALSLRLLSRFKELNPCQITKSSIMLGFSESEQEVIESMRDLKAAGCDIITLGQYLAPSSLHYPVKEFIEPEKFSQYQEIGLNIGFKAVLSGPLVRSSYKAQELYTTAKEKTKESLCMI